MLVIFIYLLILLRFEKVFIYNHRSDCLGLNMPGACSSSPLWSHGLRHSLNNAISPLCFDYLHTLASNT